MYTTSSPSVSSYQSLVPLASLSRLDEMLIFSFPGAWPRQPQAQSGLAPHFSPKANPSRDTPAALLFSPRSLLIQPIAAWQTRCLRRGGSSLALDAFVSLFNKLPALLQTKISYERILLSISVRYHTPRTWLPSTLIVPDRPRNGEVQARTSWQSVPSGS